MKRVYFLLPLMAAVSIAACSGIIGPDEDNFVFDSIRVNYDSAMVDNAEAFSLLRNIQVDGLILLPHACHTLGGDYERSGGQITLTVTATATSTTCTAAITAMQYRLQTFGMPRGAYRLRVYHQFGSAQRTLIAEQDLVIG
jgi:hypothetical protein